jgi:hypothetical protein
MCTADVDWKVTIDHRPDGVKLHRLALEAHLPEIDGRQWAQVRALWSAARSDKDRENAMMAGWGTAGVRFLRALPALDNVFQAGGQGRLALRRRLDTIFAEQQGGGEPMPVPPAPPSRRGRL